MLKIRYHTSFKKDYKKVIKRGLGDNQIREDSMGVPAAITDIAYG